MPAKLYTYYPLISRVKKYLLIFMVSLFSLHLYSADYVREILLTTQSQVYKYQYLYNQDNLLVMELELVSQGSSWVNSSRVVRTYSGEYLTLETHEKWLESKWVTINSMEFVYDSEQLLNTIEKTFLDVAPYSLVSTFTTQYELVADVVRPVRMKSQDGEQATIISYAYKTSQTNGELDSFAILSGDNADNAADSLARVVFRRSADKEVAQLDYYGDNKWQPELRFTSFLNNITRNEKYQTVEIYKQTPSGMSWVPLQSANSDFLPDGSDAFIVRSWNQMAWNPLARFEKTYDESLRLKNWSWQQSIFNTWREVASVEYDSVNKTCVAQSQLSFWGRDMQADMPIECDFLRQNNIPIKDGTRMEVVYGNRIYTSLETLGSLGMSLTMAYPNPTDGELIISSDGIISQAGVYNLAGVLMFSAKPNSNYVTLNLSHLQDGIYLVKAYVNGISQTVKIIKTAP